MRTVTPCLWFDRQAEEAVRFYTDLLPGSGIDSVMTAPTDYPGGGKAGDVLQVGFTLMDRPFIAINGGPAFRFTEAVSLTIPCKTQAEADRFAEALSADRDAEQCGWVKDHWGLSWQLVPDRLGELLEDGDPAVRARVMQAMLAMKRLQSAYSTSDTYRSSPARYSGHSIRMRMSSKSLSVQPGTCQLAASSQPSTVPGGRSSQP